MCDVRRDSWDFFFVKSDQRHDGDNHRGAGAVPGHRPREGSAGGGDGQGEGSEKVAQADAGRRGALVCLRSITKQLCK